MKRNRNMPDLGYRRGRKSELEGREGAVVGTLDSPLIPWMEIEGGGKGVGLVMGKRQVEHNANAVLQYHPCRTDLNRARRGLSWGPLSD